MAPRMRFTLRMVLRPPAEFRQLDDKFSQVDDKQVDDKVDDYKDWFTQPGVANGWLGVRR